MLIETKPTVRGITKEYIRREFDIDFHRQEKSIHYYQNELDIDYLSGSYISIAEFTSFIKSQAEKFGSTLIKIERSYDDLELYLYSLERVPESDDEVVVRLQKEQKEIIRLKDKETKQRAEYERLKSIYEG